MAVRSPLPTPRPVGASAASAPFPLPLYTLYTPPSSCDLSAPWCKPDLRRQLRSLRRQPSLWCQPLIANLYHSDERHPARSLGERPAGTYRQRQSMHLHSMHQPPLCPRPPQRLRNSPPPRAAACVGNSRF
eukprot:scaffold23460_cov69-Phaeocystis_antarctica.AAC.1